MSERDEPVGAEQTTRSLLTCAACGVPGAGRFCAECGAPLLGARCGACDTELVAGAIFCHHCGESVGHGTSSSRQPDSALGADRGRSHAFSWAIAVAAFVALAAFVLVQRPADSTAAVPGAVAGPDSPVPDAGAGSPPDISNMTPRERAERLYDHAMRASESGKVDSARFFATMATMAYRQIDDLSLDDRYDLGRLALLAGAAPLAVAEADTILAIRPTHLLGLMLAEDAARATGDASTARKAHARFVADAAKERAVPLPEYRRHAAEIEAALAADSLSTTAPRKPASKP